MKRISIADVQVPIEVVLGEAKATIEDLTRLGEGTIVEIDKLAGEPVELKAAGTVVARGEVVVIDENFGVRITSIVNDDE